MSVHAKAFHAPQKARHSSLWDIIGMPPRGAKLHEALREGLSFSVYTKLAGAADLKQKDLAQYVAIAPATLQRRAKAGRFNAEESDRLYRFAEVLETATELFEGDVARARQWITHPVRGLGGRRPVEMIATSAETGAVLDLIGRMEHGVFA